MMRMEIVFWTAGFESFYSLWILIQLEAFAGLVEQKYWVGLMDRKELELVY